MASHKSFFDTEEIPCVLPSDPEFATLNSFYRRDKPKSPLAIVCPRNAEDVAAAVKYATSHALKIVMRSGGGDLFGRSQVDDALTIDMRAIDYVEVDKEASIAKVGGGILAGGVAAELAKHELATAVGSIRAVGYVGYATLGGYGPFAPHFGLGVDQVVGAKLVNWKGEIIEADSELLKGIRGGGGNFGVIVELNLKVYPLKKILGGLIIYGAPDIASAFRSYVQGYNKLLADGLPPALGVQPMVVFSPDQGAMFGAMFVWSSPDFEEGRSYLEKIAMLGTPILKGVDEITVPDLMEMVSKLAPYGVYGGDRSVSLSKITDEVAEVIGRHIAKLPGDPGTGFSWHEARGQSTNANDSSVFGAREPHYVLELLGTAVDPANQEITEAWAEDFYNELRQCEDVLDRRYISLTKPEDGTLSDFYGSNLDTLVKLKKVYDPEGVFNLAVPRLHECEGSI